MLCWMRSTAKIRAHLGQLLRISSLADSDSFAKPFYASMLGLACLVDKIALRMVVIDGVGRILARVLTLWAGGGPANQGTR